LNRLSLRIALACAPLLATAGGCSAATPPAMPTVASVDLPRFMGRWYVIGNIPTRIEREAHNAVETYTLAPDGTIDTVFTMRKGFFDGPLKTYNPKGFVLDRDSNALWGMQFIWPIKADYRIIFLSPDYSTTVIGRQKRDYAWIMARTPQIPQAGYEELLRFLASQGYDTSRVRLVPQRWPE
jgi:apolipoprotein D and lipocalin family protein